MAKKAAKTKEKKVGRGITELETYALAMEIIEEGDVPVREEEIEDVTQALLESLDGADENDERVTKEMIEWFNIEAEKRGLFEAAPEDEKREASEKEETEELKLELAGGEVGKEIKSMPEKEKPKKEKVEKEKPKKEKREKPKKMTKDQAFCEALKKGGTDEEIISYMDKLHGGALSWTEGFYKLRMKPLIILNLIKKDEKGKWKLVG